MNPSCSCNDYPTPSTGPFFRASESCSNTTCSVTASLLQLSVCPWEDALSVVKPSGPPVIGTFGLLYNLNPVASME